MRARELMNVDVVSVRPDAPVWRICAILLEKQIGGLPVIDETGLLVGVISDGDLIGRDDSQRAARWDWWLALLVQERQIDTGMLDRAAQRVASDIMSAPVITIAEDTDSSEIARLMMTHHVKRVPVLKNGRISGIVTRGDLQRAIAAEATKAPQAGHAKIFASAVAAIDEGFSVHRKSEAPKGPSLSPPIKEDDLKVKDFRQLVSDFERKEVQDQETAHLAVLEQRRSRVAELIDRHITDENWRLLIHQARKAAQSGEKDFMLLRFPSALCADGSRAINVGETAWPASLRGEAAEVYLRWERDLKPGGFHLSARILEFPDGLPGDVGLSLAWGEQSF